MAITIYDLPDSVNSDYARRQAQYDQEVAAGRVTPAGIAEAAAYQAARVRSVQPQPSQLDSLMGLDVQSQIAHFVMMPGGEVRRSFSVMSAPSLGSVTVRVAARERIHDVLRGLPPAEAADNEWGGQAICSAIDQTIQQDTESNFVLGQMGALTAG